MSQFKHLLTRARARQCSCSHSPIIEHFALLQQIDVSEFFSLFVDRFFLLCFVVVSPLTLSYNSCMQSIWREVCGGCGSSSKNIIKTNKRSLHKYINSLYAHFVSIKAANLKFKCIKCCWLIKLFRLQSGALYAFVMWKIEPSIVADAVVISFFVELCNSFKSNYFFNVCCQMLLACGPFTGTYWFQSLSLPVFSLLVFETTANGFSRPRNLIFPMDNFFSALNFHWENVKRVEKDCIWATRIQCFID